MSSLVLTEEQELLRDTARDYVKANAPLSELRSLRDSRDASGFSRGLWKEMAELGWAGIPFSEEVGGAGLGYAELGVALEQMGRSLVATPILSSVVLSGSAIELAASDAQKKDLLGPICEGNRIVALACQETARFDPYRVSTRAELDGDGYRLSGRKTFVLDGHVADSLIVVARVSGGPGDRDGLGLFLVDPSANGVEIQRTLMVDSRNAARVELDGVRVEPQSVLGRPGHAADVLDVVFDRAAVALAAEMLGGIQEAFDRTLAYLKEREQFGQKIGSFQGLKHRAADWFCEIELTRSIVLEALRAIDENSPKLAELASAAKARASDVFMRSGEEGVQMFGGIGMTDEEDIGFFLKRARVAEQSFGDSGYHRARFAALRDY